MFVKILLIALTLIIYQFSWSSHEFSHQEIWTMSENNTSTPIDISIHISSQSQWTKDEIKDRLLFANQALETCQFSLRHVYVFNWTQSDSLLRVDDNLTSAYYDGLYEASRKAFRITPIQLFYFQDYLETFSSGGSWPFAIYPDNKTAPHLFNTAWFPYNDPRRLKKLDPTYSLEAHEMGHILLKSGHDSSHLKSIMADNSNLRLNSFGHLCQDLSLPRKFKQESSCSQIAEDINPIFSFQAQQYSDQSYMSLWCARNSDNLYKKMDLLGVYLKKSYAVFVMNKDLTTSIKPNLSRDQNTTWSFHNFLLIDGLVIDQDYTQTPTLSGVHNYLKNMWGHQESDLIFQIRPIDKILHYTLQEVKASFDQNLFPTMNAKELKLFFSTQSCYSF